MLNMCWLYVDYVWNRCWKQVRSGSKKYLSKILFRFFLTQMDETAHVFLFPRKPSWTLNRLISSCILWPQTSKNSYADWFDGSKLCSWNSGNLNATWYWFTLSTLLHAKVAKAPANGTRHCCIVGQVVFFMFLNSDTRGLDSHSS